MSIENSRFVPFETTLEVRDTCLCLHVQRAARALARRFDEALRPVGLTNGQFSLLMALNRPGPAAMGPVARLLAMDRTTLTAALKPLERLGLVAIEADPADRRSRADLACRPCRGRGQATRPRTGCAARRAGGALPARLIETRGAETACGDSV